MIYRIHLCSMNKQSTSILEKNGTNQKIRGIKRWDCAVVEILMEALMTFVSH